MNGFDGFSELMFINCVPLAISVMVQLDLLNNPVSLFFLIIFLHPPPPHTHMYSKIINFTQRERIGYLHKIMTLLGL